MPSGSIFFYRAASAHIEGLMKKTWKSNALPTDWFWSQPFTIDMLYIHHWCQLNSIGRPSQTENWSFSSIYTNVTRLPLRYYMDGGKKRG
jgi:hypothetical protein